jgi:hypothetical protein
LPTGFWIQKEYKNKGKIIMVDIKRAKYNDTHIYWKSPSSNKLGLRIKVEIAKKFVRWILEKYPFLSPYCDVNGMIEKTDDLSQQEKDLLTKKVFDENHYDPFKNKKKKGLKEQTKPKESTE